MSVLVFHGTGHRWWVVPGFEQGSYIIAHLTAHTWSPHNAQVYHPAEMYLQLKACYIMITLSYGTRNMTNHELSQCQ